MPNPTATETLWASILEDFRNSLSRDIYRNWFESIEAKTDETGTLELCTSSEFSRIWLEDNYLDLIRDKAAGIAGEEVMVRISTPPPSA
jgi:chromosomal replication initiation ATPase DnaA